MSDINHQLERKINKPVSLSFSFCVLWYVFFLLLCYQFIRATVSAQRASSVLFTSCQFVMLLSIFYEQLNDDDDDEAVGT